MVLHCMSRLISPTKHVRHVAFQRFSFQCTAARDFIVFCELMENFLQLATVEFAFLASLIEMAKTAEAPTVGRREWRGGALSYQKTSFWNRGARRRGPSPFKIFDPRQCGDHGLRGSDELRTQVHIRYAIPTALTRSSNYISPYRITANSNAELTMSHSTLLHWLFWVKT